MEARQVLLDTAVGAAGGLVASTVMNPVTQAILDRQSQESREREEAASGGQSAMQVGVQKGASALGIELAPEQAQKAASALHYGVGLLGAPLYMVLRRTTSMTPLGAGMTAGIGVFVAVDEVANTVLGLAPPPNRYPIVTHLRGLAGHLVFGIALAAAVEVGWRLTRKIP